MPTVLLFDDVATATDINDHNSDYTRDKADTGTAGDAYTLLAIPRFTLAYPTDGEVDVTPDTPIQIDLTDAAEFAAGLDSVSVTVNGVNVWADSAPKYGWAGRLIYTSDTTKSLFLFPPTGFDYNETITVAVVFSYGKSIIKQDTCSTTETRTIV